jgi:hypothetical protein
VTEKDAGRGGGGETAVSGPGAGSAGALGDVGWDVELESSLFAASSAPEGSRMSSASRGAAGALSRHATVAAAIVATRRARIMEGRIRSSLYVSCTDALGGSDFCASHVVVYLRTAHGVTVRQACDAAAIARV